MGQLPTAESELQWIEQENRHASDPAVALQRASLLETLARYPEALAGYTVVQELLEQSGKPPDPAAAKGAASVLFRIGRFEESLDLVARAASLIRKQGLVEDWELAKIRGNCLCRMGRLKESLAAYSEAEDIQLSQGQPAYPFLSMNRGAVYQELGRLEDALAEFGNTQRLLEEQGLPPDHDLEMNRGVVLSFMFRFDEALAAYEKAMSLLKASGLPEDANMLMNLGDLLSETGHHDRALELFERSAELRSQRGQEPSHVLMFHRAMALARAGQREQALAEGMRSIQEAGRQGIVVKPFYSEKLQDWLSAPAAGPAGPAAGQSRLADQVPDHQKRHDVFISYRRRPGLPHAMLLKLHLDLKGRSVFRDQDDLRAGHFEEDLVEAIRYSRFVLVLLTKDFFERCISDEADVARKELATALSSGTPIIPVMMEGFSWPSPAELPEDIRALTGVNAMSWSDEFFSAFIDKLLSWME